MKHVECNQVNSVCNDISIYQDLLEGEVHKNYFLCNPKKKSQIVRSGEPGGQESNVTSLTLGKIYHCGSLLLRNLRASKDQCGDAPSCCKIKSSPSTCIVGIVNL